MDLFENYKPVAAILSFVSNSGFYNVTITDIEEGKTKSARNYIAVTCDVDTENEGQIIQIVFYLVEGKNFNRDATLFFDTFGINRDVRDYDLWIGKIGQVFIELNNGQMTPKWIINQQGFACTQNDMCEMMPWPSKPQLSVKITFN